MTDQDTFAAPGWGTWEQNRAHNPLPVTRLTQELYPAGFGKGFEEGVVALGAPMVSVTMGFARGFDYIRFQFIGEPGADGPMEPDAIGGVVMAREAAAAKAFEERAWRAAIDLWDGTLKPAAVVRHRELADVDLAALDDDALAAHVDELMDHHQAMVYQHHRFNIAALLPVGDFALKTAQWTGRAPEAILGLFEGYSPISGIWSDEIAPAAIAVAGNDGARQILAGSADDPAGTLSQLREAVPEVDDLVRSVGFRVVDGFDFLAPTLSERPGLLLGKLAAAVDMGGPSNRAAVEKLEAEIRAEVPEGQRAEFDDLLTEARLVYRLRDERGIYSDMSSAGLLRLALLELGARLVRRGVLDDPELILHAGVSDVRSLARGASSPGTTELRSVLMERDAAGEAGAPQLFGPPHAPPPPPEALPPNLGRVAAAVGFLIPAILSEVDDPSLEGNVIKGMKGNAGTVQGRARVINDFDDLAALEPGDIMVTKVTSEAFNAAIHIVSAIVTDHGGVASHAAILSREVGIPCVVGTGVATKRIEDGSTIVVDGTRGEVTLAG